jgi:hypothetical protein
MGTGRTADATSFNPYRRSSSQTTGGYDLEGNLQRRSNPIPGYQLCLEKQDTSICVDLWELCFQVCFRNYKPVHSELESQEVEIDTTLIDETGDVDWQCLDTKAQQLVAQVFADLSAV